MQVIKYIEDKFNSLCLRVKIELFLFPLLIFIIVLFLLFEEKENLKKEYISTEINIQDIQMKDKVVDILKNIEKYSLENNIYLQKMSNKGKFVKVESFASLENRLAFLSYLEYYNNFSKIKTFELEGDRLFIELEFKKFYKKDNKRISLNLNDTKKANKIKLNLQAIVGNKAYINNIWLEVDGKIGNYKISEIGNDRVILKNSYEKLILRLYKNENI